MTAQCRLSVLACALGFLAYPTSGAVNLSNKEIWIGPNSASGSGTLADPYIASNFDNIMNGLTKGNTDFAKSQNVTVHLLPGTYTVKWGISTGGHNLPDGVRLIGSGMTNTTIQAIPDTTPAADDRGYSVLETDADSTNPSSSAYVSDLTVDANWQSTGYKMSTSKGVAKAAGINVRAVQGTIERVRVINFGSSGSSSSTAEVFPMGFNGNSSGTCIITVQDCVVEGPYQTTSGAGYGAGYSSAINLGPVPSTFQVSHSWGPGTLWADNSLNFLGQQLGASSTLRNTYDGWVGAVLSVGANPVKVTDLGRWVVSGNTGSHAVKLVTSGGVDVSGGGVTVNTSGATANQFLYATLATPIMLSPNSTYYLLSREYNTGDNWYDTNFLTGPVSTPSVTVAYDANTLGFGISGNVFGTGAPYTANTGNAITNNPFGPVGLKGLILSPQRTNEQAIFRNNRVVNTGTGAGFNLMGANVILEGNIVENALTAVNSDTSGSANFLFTGNHFKNVGRGIVIGTAGDNDGSRYYWDNVLIVDNYFELNDTAAAVVNTGGYRTAGISFRSSIENAVVANNTIQVMPPFRGSVPSGSSAWYSFWIGQVPGYSNFNNKNINLVGNTIASGLALYTNVPSQLTYVSGNHTFEGDSLYEPFYTPPVFVMTTGDLWFNTDPTAHQWEENIWIATPSGGGTAVIHLPDPAGYQGRSFRLLIIGHSPTASTTVGIQCASNFTSGVDDPNVLYDMKTATTFDHSTVDNLVTWPAGGGFPTLAITLTSIAGNWKLERP